MLLREIKYEDKCKKCNHPSHCEKECLVCANDICTGCKCVKCE